jgi:hypothetical protein
MPKDKAIAVTVKVDSTDLKKLYETIDALTRRVELLERGTAINLLQPLTVTCGGTSLQADMEAVLNKSARQQRRGEK